LQFARLENAIITAFFVAIFDFEITDENGDLLKELPEVDINWSAAMPPSRPPYLKCRVRDLQLLHRALQREELHFVTERRNVKRFKD
jgi:hypothetical protein